MKINVYLGVNDLSKKNQNFPCQGRVMSQVTREITEREAQQKRQGALGLNHPQGCSWERKLLLGLCRIIWRLSPSKSDTFGQRGSESTNRGLPPCTCPGSQPGAGGVGGMDRAQDWQFFPRKPKITSRQSLPPAQPRAPALQPGASPAERTRPGPGLG